MSSHCNYKDSHKDCLPAVCLAVRRDGTHAKTSTLPCYQNVSIQLLGVICQVDGNKSVLWRQRYALLYKQIV